MIDLDEQLRDYSAWLAAEADRVAVERGQARTVDVTSVESARFRGHRWWPLVAVAAAVILVLAVVAAVGTPDAQAPADRPSAPTDPLDTVGDPDAQAPVDRPGASTDPRDTTSSRPDDTGATLPALSPAAPAPDLSGTPTGFDGAPLTARPSIGVRSDGPQAWRDGFVQLGYEMYQPQLELTDEIAAMLPLDEIERREPGWTRPGSVNEVGAWLHTFELLDAVTAELAGRPEVVAALEAGAGMVEWFLQAHFTVDGDEWRAIVLDPPTAIGARRGTISEVQVSDDRVVVSTPWQDAVERGRLEIAWTSDLVEWETMSVELDAESAPEDLNSSINDDSSLTVSGDRFIMSVRLDGGAKSEMRHFAGRLGDSSVERVDPPNSDNGFVHASEAHGTFYVGGDELWESTDGIVWRQVPDVPDLGSPLGSAIELRDGTLFAPTPGQSWNGEGEPGEQPLAVRNLSGVFRTVSPPDGVHEYTFWNGRGEFAWMVDLRSDWSDPVDRWLIATVDGDHWLTLDLTDDGDRSRFDLAINGDRVLYTEDGESWKDATIPTE